MNIDLMQQIGAYYYSQAIYVKRGMDGANENERGRAYCAMQKALAQMKPKKYTREDGESWGHYYSFPIEANDALIKEWAELKGYGFCDCMPGGSFQRNVYIAKNKFRKVLKCSGGLDI